MTLKRILVVLFSSLLLALRFNGLAQTASTGDSLLYYLGNISNADDTSRIIGAFIWLKKSPESELGNEKVLAAIERLESRVDEIDYYDLVTSYFTRLISFNTASANAISIALSERWLQKHEMPVTNYGRYTYLSVFRDLRIPYRNSGNLAKAIEYFSAAEKKFQSANDSMGISIVTNVLSGIYYRTGMLERCKYYQLKSISYLNDKQEDYALHQSALLYGVSGKVNRYSVLGSFYIANNQPAIAVGYLNEALRYFQLLKEPMYMTDVPFLFLQMARCKTMEKSDSSSYYYDRALKYMQDYSSNGFEYAAYYQERGLDFFYKNHLDSAKHYILKSRQLRDSLNIPVSGVFGELTPAYNMALILLKQNKAAEAAAILQPEIAAIRQQNNKNLLLMELTLAADAWFHAGKSDKAYQVLLEALSVKEEITSSENSARTLSFEVEKKIQESEKTILSLDAQNKNNRKVKLYLIGMVSLLGLLAIGLSIFYRNKKRNNRELSLKNERLAFTLQKLQATQTQLIQSEKMASLGELTAGIAHEIQNPLNFVNNFSELNQELASELVEEAEKGNTEIVKQIAADIKSNAEKINHHGKRADSIVKGMLQHSRSSSGQKEFTDINALCDEYLRLAYHGWRAKDHSFNAKFETQFDESVGKINVIPQDLGRVILNLINNAFFAVNERNARGEANYEPTVSVTTSFSPLPGRGVGGEVNISISDNGTGIPASLVDKIFQPFFTTKPTGQGTGLGLSLSYDIIKAHGGEIRLDSEEGRGTAFIITLPINQLS